MVIIHNRRENPGLRTAAVEGLGGAQAEICAPCLLGERSPVRLRGRGIPGGIYKLQLKLKAGGKLHHAGRADLRDAADAGESSETAASNRMAVLPISAAERVVVAVVETG